MVQAGTLPSHQLLLTAVQPCPKPADVRTFQLRKAWEGVKREKEQREAEADKEKEKGFLMSQQ